MPSSWLLSGLIGRRKHGGLKTSDGDDDHNSNLALVKAAAWAWYQHGSGSSEGKPPVAEFEVARVKPAARPSRYMLEAMRSTGLTPPLNRRRDSLLDAYEIQRISKQLGSFMEESSRSRGGVDRNGYSAALLHPQETASKEKNGSSSRALITRLRQYHGPITCGALKDVEISALVRRRRVPSKSRY
ncbi:hypothetical protein LINPERPRIM_LOCUS2982 [Linum perenne]